MVTCCDMMALPASPAALAISTCAASATTLTAPRMATGSRGRRDRAAEVGGLALSRELGARPSAPLPSVTD